MRTRRWTGENARQEVAVERLDALPGRHSAGSRTLRGRWRWPALLVPLAAFLAFGLLGLYRYVDGFWLYRGYPPPRDPACVTQHGRELTFVVPSPALGGRRQRVIVYLPPGYDSSPSR